MEWIKKNLKGEYNVKDLEEVKMIISWQVTRNLENLTLKISRLYETCLKREFSRL